jgi:hypothetical protein
MPQPSDHDQPLCRPLDVAPDESQVVLLPFTLADTDDIGARTIVSLPVAVPDDWLASILFLATTPDQIPASDSASRWATVAEFLLAAGLDDVSARWLPAVRTAADQDPTSFLWWERCRQQVRDLCQAPKPDTAG